MEAGALRSLRVGRKYVPTCSLTAAHHAASPRSIAPLLAHLEEGLGYLGTARLYPSRNIYRCCIPHSLRPCIIPACHGGYVEHTLFTLHRHR